MFNRYIFVIGLVCLMAAPGIILGFGINSQSNTETEQVSQAQLLLEQIEAN